MKKLLFFLLRLLATPGARRFQKALKGPSRAQATVLFDIVSDLKKTEYGKHLGGRRAFPSKERCCSEFSHGSPCVNRTGRMATACECGVVRGEEVGWPFLKSWKSLLTRLCSTLNGSNSGAKGSLCSEGFPKTERRSE